MVLKGKFKNNHHCDVVRLNFFTYWPFRPFDKYTLGRTIAGGFFNVMTFPALETTQSFALSSLKVSFQPSAFFAGPLAYT